MNARNVGWLANGNILLKKTQNAGEYCVSIWKMDVFSNFKNKYVF